MTGKFAGLGEDLIPRVEMTDSALHGNDRHRLANENEEETHRSFQSRGDSTKVKVEGVDAIP